MAESLKEGMAQAEEDVRGIKEGIAEKEKMRAILEQGGGEDALVAAVPVLDDHEQPTSADAPGGGSRSHSHVTSSPQPSPSPAPRRDASTVPGSAPSGKPKQPSVSPSRTGAGEEGRPDYESASASPSPYESSESLLPSVDDPLLLDLLSGITTSFGIDHIFVDNSQQGAQGNDHSGVSPAIVNVSYVFAAFMAPCVHVPS